MSVRNYCILKVSPNSSPPVFLMYFATACELNVLKTDVLRKIYGRARARVCVCVCISEREGRTETKYRRKGKFTYRQNFIVCSVHIIRLE